MTTYTQWQCTHFDGDRQCERLIDIESYSSGAMGSKALCRFHLEQRHGMPLDEIVQRERNWNEMVARGDLLCDICGARNARWVAGEGQALCEEHNYRQGINRYS